MKRVVTGRPGLAWLAESWSPVADADAELLAPGEGTPILPTRDPSVNSLAVGLPRAKTMSNA